MLFPSATLPFQKIRTFGSELLRELDQSVGRPEMEPKFVCELQPFTSQTRHG